MAAVADLQVEAAVAVVQELAGMEVEAAEAVVQEVVARAVEAAVMVAVAMVVAMVVVEVPEECRTVWQEEPMEVAAREMVAMAPGCWEVAAPAAGGTETARVEVGEMAEREPVVEVTGKVAPAAAVEAEAVKGKVVVVWVAVALEAVGMEVEAAGAVVQEVVERAVEAAVMVAVVMVVAMVVVEVPEECRTVWQEEPMEVAVREMVAMAPGGWEVAALAGAGTDTVKVEERMGVAKGPVGPAVNGEVALVAKEATAEG